MIDQKNAVRVAVVVLGMHRSGTSALTRVLGLMGCDMPRNPLGATPANETGHWEPNDVLDVNEQILQSVGSYPHDWLPVSKDWLASEDASVFRKKAVRALRSEFPQSRLFALKEPRICRLFAFWREILSSEGIRPVVMFPVRNPVEVARSLKSRDNFDLSWGYLMWLRNVLDGEFDSRDVPRHFASYEQLLSDWRKLFVEAQEALGLTWPVSPDQADEEVSAYLSGSYRHHVTDSADVFDDPAISPWVKDVYRVMRKWCETGEDRSDWQTLDRVRAEMESAIPAFGQVIAAGWGAVQENRILDQKTAEMVSQQTAERAVANETRSQLESALENRASAEREVGRLQEIARRHEEELEQSARAHAEQIAEMTRVSQAEREREVARHAEELEQATVAHQAAIARLTLQHRTELERLQTVNLERVSKLKSEHQARDARLASELQAAKARLARFKVASTERNHHVVEAIVAADGTFPYRTTVGLRKDILRKTGLFDEDFYRSKYPDIAASDIDPVHHYIRFGGKEGRFWSKEISSLERDKAALDEGAEAGNTKR